MINDHYHYWPILKQNPATLALIEAEILFEKKDCSGKQEKAPGIKS